MTASRQLAREAHTGNAAQDSAQDDRGGMFFSEAPSLLRFCVAA
jgi:hypothetical protein